MMNNQPNDLVALEWLVLPINEEFDAIHENWQAQIDIGTPVFEAVGTHLHTLGGVFTVANLGVFAELAYELEQLTNHLTAGRLDITQAPYGLYASKLLQYEFSRFVLKGGNQPTLIRLRLNAIRKLIQNVDNTTPVALGVVANEERFSARLSPLGIQPLLLSQANYQKLAQAWQHSSEQLLSSNQNNADALNNLKKVADYLKQGSLDHALQCLWHTSGLLLVGLIYNSKPLPHEYRFLLTELACAIEVQLYKQYDDVEKVVWLENLLIDLYVQLSELDTVAEDTYEFLMGLNSTIANEQAFFPHILSVLEGVLFGLAQGEIYAEVIEEIQEQFAHRGWSFYASYAEQIANDIKTAQTDPEQFAQMQWQINTQVQDLYTAISNTHEAILSKIGQSGAVQAGSDDSYNDSLRKVRTLIERVKNALSSYLTTKTIDQLPEAEMFAELDNSFNEMGMYTVSDTTAKLAKLFTELRDDNPARISWQFAHALAESLSMLELFLDGLARQIFDNALLTKANERIDEAHSLLGVMDEAEEFGDEAVEDGVVRYDDSGEILPDIQTSAVANEPAVQEADGEALTQEQAKLAESTELMTDEISDVSDIVADSSQALANDDDLIQTNEANPEVVTADMVVSEAYLNAKAQLKDDDFSHDDEIREIFIEEADEVLETLNELLPVWQADVKDFTPLTDIRRGFHTLKGSGRMVGAFNEGEMAWAVENLLNRVLDGTVAATPVLANFVAETAGLIPTLVKDFEQKQVPSIDPAIVVLKANNLLAGKDIDADMPTMLADGLVSDELDESIVSEDLTEDSTVAQEEGVYEENIHEAATYEEVVALEDEEVKEYAVSDDMAVQTDAVMQDEHAELMAFLPQDERDETQQESEVWVDDEAIDEFITDDDVVQVADGYEEALTDDLLTSSIISADEGLAIDFNEVADFIKADDEQTDAQTDVQEAALDNDIASTDEIFGEEIDLDDTILDDEVDSVEIEEIIDGEFLGENEAIDEVTDVIVSDTDESAELLLLDDEIDDFVTADDEMTTHKFAVGESVDLNDEVIELTDTADAEEMTDTTDEILTDEPLYDSEAVTIEELAEDIVSTGRIADDTEVADVATDVNVDDIKDDVIDAEEVVIDEVAVSVNDSDVLSHEIDGEILTDDMFVDGTADDVDDIVQIDDGIDDTIATDEVQNDAAEAIEVVEATDLAEENKSQSDDSASETAQEIVIFNAGFIEEAELALSADYTADDYTVYDNIAAAEGVNTDDTLVGEADVGIGELSSQSDEQIVGGEITADVPSEMEVDAVSMEEAQTDTQDDEPVDGAFALPAVLLPFMVMVNEATSTVNEDMDDDIKEIFIEEAGEVLESIIPLFGEWCGTRTDTAALTDIRRGFHTLKGSGRMVGAGEIGELAWSIENMLNRVLDGTAMVDDGMVLLIQDVLSGFGGLVGIFASGGNEYPEMMKLWAACAHAYSKGHGGEFDYRDFAESGKSEQTKAGSVQDTQDDEPDFVSITDDESEVLESPNTSRLNKSASDALTSMQEASERILSAQWQAPSDEEEQALCEIFVEEARELLGGVSQFLSDNQDSDEVPVNDEIVRAFHTLRGASGLRPLVAVSEVSALIEKSLQGLQQHDAMMVDKHKEALSTAVLLIEDHLNGYEDSLNGNADNDKLADFEEDKHLIENLLQESSAKEDIDVATLIDGVDELLDAELDLENVAIRSQDEHQDEMAAYANTLLAQIEVLEGRTLQSSKFQKVLLSLSSAYRTLAHHPEQAENDSLIDALLNAHGELTGLFDSLAGSMSLRINESVLHTLDGKVQDIQSYYKAQAEQEASAHAKEKVLPQAPAAARYQAIDTDDELLEIFLEEAGELDEAIGEEFKKWRADTSNVDALKALQRHLHTIKGGARLAGISSIGDLTHEAETVYEQLVDGRLNASSGWVNVMQDVQDLLSLQIEQVKSHKQSFFADDAVAQLQVFLNAKEVTEDTRLVSPVLEEMPVNEVVEASENTQADVAIGNEMMGDFAKRQLRSWQGNLPDDDILAVFLEEAEELVENSSESLQAFRNNTGDLASLQSLQRHLHTIKGGARMVTANGVADLAHNMETVYEDLGSRRRPATRMVTQLLMACHDWLAQAVYLLKFKLNAPRPTPLIEALELFIDNPDSLVEVPVVSMAEEIEAIHAFEAEERQRLGGKDISRMPAMMGNFAKSEEATVSNEMIRISAGLMERMINLSGEAAINRARIDMSMSSLTASIEEMGMTVQRLHDQLRRMDIELEAQILAQIDDKTLLYEGFDPLEMDQYSSLNQLSKSLSESASDLLDIKATLLEKTRDGENLLLQLSRTQNELQDGLMNSRMVPFSRLTPRLQRIVRQISGELGKRVELTVVNADDEVDRTILERITSPLEHMLRNAMDHGIELPEVREAKGKSAMGHVKLELERVGSEILVHLTDDGAGVNVEAVRKKAIAQGLIDVNDDTLSDLDIMQYIFNAGLSTTTQITQISGRGVGMDVVRSEIRQLGGSVSVESEQGKGSKFTIRVPLTVAVADTLVVRAADRQYAIPLVQIERVTQVSPRTLINYYQSSQGTLDIEGVPYRLRYLNEILSGHNFSELLTANSSLPVIIIKNQAGQNLALQVDEIVGSRIEIVVKPLGRQLSHLAGISAATIMGDGSVMLILDLMALIRNAQARVAVEVEQKAVSKRPTILVVDDSVTVRKVTSRFLERQGFEAIVAKDGVDAIEMLQELTPDLMLLDIEMPRMDGFEVATQVRHNARLQDLPIIMITSRTGEKHRERAFEIGVNDYMGKPFQENELLGRIQTLLAK